MPRLLAALVALASLLLAPPLAASGEVATIETEHVRADIVLRNATTAPGDVAEIAIRHTLADGWHTYWTNPGDSGEPPIVDWTLPEGAAALDLAFPVPEAIPYPPLVNHGYKGEFTLMTGVTVPQDWPTGTPLPVTVRMDWLVCEQICIPEGGEASFMIPTGAASEPDSAVAFTFVQAEWALPEESDAAATYSRDGETIWLSVPVGEPAGAHFFALDRDALDHTAEQVAVEVADGPGMTVRLTGGRGALDGTLEGVLATDDGAWRITATGEPDPEPPAAAAPAAVEPLTLPTSGDAAPSSPAAVPGAAALMPDIPALGLGQAVLFAFLGGVILNLMPCVFPVLALKALGLVSHAGAPFPRRAAHAGAYTAGILASFAVLAAALLALEAAGVAAGWGFQLQSPPFVAVMALVIFAVGLNLSGVFEIGTSLTRLGGHGARDGLGGSFATGLLATVVATPCTAPFMAAAIGAALAASPPTMFAVFGGLGLGLAAPFVVLALVPGLARVLPKPGVWMERLKQALAFPLYATAAWLVWVLAQLAGTEALPPVFAGLVLTAFAAWLFGLSQRGSGRSHRLATGLAAASLAAGLLALWPAATGTPPRPVASAEASGLAQPFSPDRLAALRDEGAPVFVNVTAAWCITCKVNERVVLDDPAFNALLSEAGVSYLVADWTRRDPDISRFMEGFGRAGVPLYVAFDREGEARILPQVLTLATLRDAFASE
jgi:thiol:disulfide interchange protein DsbD